MKHHINIQFLLKKHKDMFKSLKITLFTLLLLASNSLFSQTESIRSQILEYNDSKSNVIEKGRGLLFDKFIEGDIAKVKEIKDYLLTLEDENYSIFFPTEYWFILYWTNEFSTLAESLKSYNSEIYDFHEVSFFLYLSGVKLTEKLRHATMENEAFIKAQLQMADIDSETKQILHLNLDKLLVKSRNYSHAQDSLNEQADRFLENYPSSDYTAYVKNHIRYRLIPKNWGFAVEFFSGYGAYDGNLSKNYTNNIPLGVAFDVCYRNFELYLRDYIGFNKTKKDVDYSVGVWEKGSSAMVFFPEASLGYKTYENDQYKVSPFLGIGSMAITPPFKKTEDTPELEEVELSFTTTYMLGINFDIKLGKKHESKYDPKTSYGFLRIRYAYGLPQFSKKYNGMTGNMHYITIGIGGMSRGVKRVL